MAAITTIPPINDPVSNLRPLDSFGRGFAVGFVAVVVVGGDFGVLDNVDEFEGACEVVFVVLTGMVEFVGLEVPGEGVAVLTEIVDESVGDTDELVVVVVLFFFSVVGEVTEVELELASLLVVVEVAINKLKNLV